MENVTVNLPPFGAYIPGQGGHFAAIMRGPDNTPHALLVSAQDTEIAECQWGTYGKDIDGAKSRTDGHANTAAMLAADRPAATGATRVEADGHKDFFLPALGQLNIMRLATPQSAILSAVIFNALIIVALIPLALKGVRYRPSSASALLRRNLLIYGLGGVVTPFAGIWLIDLLVRLIPGIG